jgi:hypothetical protein
MRVRLPFVPPDTGPHSMAAKLAWTEWLYGVPLVFRSSSDSGGYGPASCCGLHVCCCRKEPAKGAQKAHAQT